MVQVDVRTTKLPQKHDRNAKQNTHTPKKKKVLLVGLQSGSVIVVQGDVQHNKVTMRVLTSAHQTGNFCM